MRKSREIRGKVGKWGTESKYEKVGKYGKVGKYEEKYDLINKTKQQKENQQVTCLNSLKAGVLFKTCLFTLQYHPI